MCGIAGILSFTPDEKIEQTLLEKMNNAQQHRGPNDQGYYNQNGVGLAHRRLSIIDLSGGHQPIFNEDGQVVVVFNGEIYNFQNIAEELKKLGHTFKTHSDTETIVHAWEEWGVNCLEHFNGMFAFALWDNNKNELFIARDRIGEKPLHYALIDNQLIFGSELKVLKQHPACPKEIDPRAIEDYLTLGYIPDPKCIYKNVHKLQAGHYLHIKKSDKDTVKQIQYWDLPWQEAPYTDTQTINQELINRLKAAVDLRLVSEVPLGAFLSGGVDSSAIVAMMSQLQNQPVNTCAIGFDVPEFNETDFAQLVAERYKTEHRVEIINHQDFDLIDKLIQVYDEPYADSSALPTYRVCEMARKHVTVCLSGDGGDELFAGYRRYKLHLQEEKARNKIPFALRKPIFTTLGKLYPKADWAPQYLRAKTTFQSLGMSSAHAYLNSMSKLRSDERNKLYSKQFKQKLNGYDSRAVFDQVLNGKKFKDPLKMAQYLDFKTWMTGDILTKVDRASMAHALEVRVPMLDHTFVEWAFKVPSELNLKQGEGKASLKSSLEPHLPHDNLYRKKMGFSIPLAQWLRGPLKNKLESTLNSVELKNIGIFDSHQLNKLNQQHQSGQSDHSASLWTIMMLGLFLKREASSYAS
ncbi:XrtA/PEP-CTERM system amidotransferase [Catenovulum adriaticum]|uniref:asparagine synthase (glutamine-hydrolyzing) n=1 Tax=Catenovulum adriaticum TaxID=2984846 RepID=A0ABY7AMI5_9ALTE|nr:XrtA/PEP-CTERM system amidotransferase [Catenovulum sp. TS8]WAJ70704.1 amidotransferase 1, exosortase A system-associated [Catenovulum sp. TS8]